MPSTDSSAPDEGEATNASTDDTADDDHEGEKTILDRLVDVLWILPW
ncbi:MULTISPECIES: hypothetical protein [unclassified Haloferax]|nr:MULTISPECIES: hypothetical protein [unclassified Haloferax]ELZ58378.1 hypothetical protein C460_09342 [Haloferax sp. ATCC BAA-646]ELZ62667.1 hypothetical protein C458_16980 [Haloferax sp. ATCC BAA-644]ELZ63549.1 hypothetical protein C459_10724 [Haloferax sp. ATCC BAA-645]